MLRHWSCHHASHWIWESRPCRVPGCNRLLGYLGIGCEGTQWYPRLWLIMSIFGLLDIFGVISCYIMLYPMCIIVYPLSDKPGVETRWVWVQSGTGLIRKEAERPTMVMSQCSNVHKLLYNMQSWFFALLKRHLHRATCAVLRCTKRFPKKWTFETITITSISR